MKRLDKFILQSFLGPFVLTFCVVVFILLMQFLLKYFDELVGKNLGAAVYAELLFFFSINMTALALPLAVLLSSLMTYGNLGEHFELTAIKSAGISLTRTLLPIFAFTILLSVIAFINNDRVVPKANLRAYSLLYDIKQTKPSLSLQEGAFYNGIPNYSIKVNKKYPDEVTLGDLIIYDHSKGRGNTDIILADSGRMYTINNDRYLMLEMFDGTSYSESSSNKEQRPSPHSSQPADFVRNHFKQSKIVFSLETFDMVETKKEYFANNRIMKNLKQLSNDLDSMDGRLVEARYNIYQNAANYLTYSRLTKTEAPAGLEKSYQEYDSLRRAKELALMEADTTAPLPPSAGQSAERPLRTDLEQQGRKAKIALQDRRLKEEKKAVYVPSLEDTSALAALEARLTTAEQQKNVYKSAIGQVRYTKNNYDVYGSRSQELQRNYYIWQIEWHKKWAQATACLVMFLIGAPLGAIIKRGGLGVPVIVSIVFFIVYYVLTMFGEKWAREGIVSPAAGVWAANLLLLPFGLIFLIQARNDARLFESDFYMSWIARLRALLGERIVRPDLLRKQPRSAE